MECFEQSGEVLLLSPPADKSQVVAEGQFWVRAEDIGHHVVGDHRYLPGIGSVLLDHILLLPVRGDNTGVGFQEGFSLQAESLFGLPAVAVPVTGKLAEQVPAPDDDLFPENLLQPERNLRSPYLVGLEDVRPLQAAAVIEQQAAGGHQFVAMPGCGQHPDRMEPFRKSGVAPGAVRDEVHLVHAPGQLPVEGRFPLQVSYLVPGLQTDSAGEKQGQCCLPYIHVTVVSF